MTTIPTTTTIDRMLNETGYPMISIYMPTHRAGADIWQDPIRFKNLVRAAEHNLEASGADPHEVRKLLRPLAELYEDRSFWQHQSEGFALFRSAEKLEHFRLPMEVPELSIVGDRFHLKPLLLALAEERTFYVLALSQHAARLFKGSPLGLTEVEGLEFPEGLQERDADGERMLQAHAVGGGAQVQHGGELDTKGRVEAYCRKVDEVVRGVAGAHDFVVLAAVEYVAAIYRGVSGLRGLAERMAAGSPDHLGVDELFAKAMPIAREHFEGLAAGAGERFFASQRAGKALDTATETIQAARQGRVETLFVPVGVHVWGHFGDGGEVRVHEAQGPQDEDLLNNAVIDTWKNGGRVVVLPPEKMPGGRQVAAITRF